MKSQKGITLIALVITIIVMLILVSVTITMAINGGLFGYAEDASVKTNDALTREQNLASGYLNVGTDAATQDVDINTVVNHYIDGTY